MYIDIDVDDIMIILYIKDILEEIDGILRDR